MLTICTWLWGQKFDETDVRKLFAGVQRNLSQPARFIAITDRYLNISGVECVPIIDTELTKIKGCYARLRMFDPQWQRDHGIDERLACIDLDTVITGPLDPLFDRPESFLIMQGGNATNPCKFNGAMMMLRAGCHAEVWDGFTVEKAAKVPHFEFPDDQGWLWHKLPNASGWVCGAESGVYVFHKPGWLNYTHDVSALSTDLPDGARLVTFSGRRSPQKFAHLDWVKEHWR